MGEVVPFVRAVLAAADGPWTAAERAELNKLAAVITRDGMLGYDVSLGSAECGDPWFAISMPASGETLLHVARIRGQFIVHHVVDDLAEEGPDLRSVIRRATRDGLPELGGFGPGAAVLLLLLQQTLDFASRPALAAGWDAASHDLDGLEQPTLSWQSDWASMIAVEQPTIETEICTVDWNVAAPSATASDANPSLPLPDSFTPAALPQYPVFPEAPIASLGEPLVDEPSTVASTTAASDDVRRSEAPMEEPEPVEVLGPSRRSLAVPADLSGDNEFFGDVGRDRIDGGPGNDLIHLGPGRDIGLGGLGADTVYGEGGADLLRGGPGDDLLSGDRGQDHVLGGHGNDYLSGGSGNDTLSGRQGRDSLYGSLGADLLAGDGGHDRLFGGANNDTILGGVGRDLLDGNSGNDFLEGGASNDTLHGGTGNDTLLGGPGRDRLHGEGGDDVLDSGDGAESIFGDAGDDFIYVRSGNTAAGGSGADHFEIGSMRSPSQSQQRHLQQAVILDYNPSEGDTYVISDLGLEIVDVPDPDNGNRHILRISWREVNDKGADTLLPAPTDDPAAPLAIPSPLTEHPFG